MLCIDLKGAERIFNLSVIASNNYPFVKHPCPMVAAFLMIVVTLIVSTICPPWMIEYSLLLHFLALTLRVAKESNKTLSDQCIKHDKQRKKRKSLPPPTKVLLVTVIKKCPLQWSLFLLFCCCLTQFPHCYVHIWPPKFTGTKKIGCRDW